MASVSIERINPKRQPKKRERSETALDVSSETPKRTKTNTKVIGVSCFFI